MKHSRIMVRTIVFPLAVFLALQAGTESAGTPSIPRETAALLPALSPFAAACAGIASRSVSLLAVLAMPVLILSIVRGRWFCRWVCPTGLLTEVAWKLRIGRWKTPWAVPAGRFVALAGLAAAALGSGLFIWLDPLALFNGFFASLWPPIFRPALLLAVGLPIVVGAALFAPTLWCYGLCPLGAIQGMLGDVRHAFRNHATSQDVPRAGRRAFLGLGAGLALGSLLRVLPRNGKNEIPIRPPGALPEGEFAGACERCGNCIRSCPTRIIRPDVGRSGIAGFLAPAVELALGVPGNPSASAYCEEYCNECNKVCPTGAIRRLTLEEKVNLRMGTAKIDQSLCIAWARSAHCMVCHEFCPYSAIKIIARNGVNCPEVKEDACRGCGLCQVQCPALNGKAIVVHGRVQDQVKPEFRIVGQA